MASDTLYDHPLIESFEIQGEAVVCDSDVVAVYIDYGQAVEEEW